MSVGVSTAGTVRKSIAVFPERICGELPKFCHEKQSFLQPRARFRPVS